jgi:hypothetical protein
MKFNFTNCFLFLLFCLVAFLSALGLPWFMWSDGVEHAAAVKELVHNLFNPQNPLLPLDGSTSPRFVPSIMLMALFMKAVPLDISTIVSLFTLIFFVLFAYSVWRFSCTYFADKGQGIYSLLAVLFLWGKGWDGANAYMFSVLVWNAYYPSLVSFSLALLGYSYLLEHLRRGRRNYVPAYLAISCLVFLNHPLTGSFYFLITPLLLLSEKKANLKNISVFASSVIITALVAFLWPYYSHAALARTMIGTSLNEFWDYTFTWNYLYSGVLTRSGPALLGIPVLAYYLRSRQHACLICGFVVCFMIYVLSYLFKLHLGERYIFFSIFFLQLAFSRYVRETSLFSYASLKAVLNPFTWKGCTTLTLLLGLIGGIAGQAYFTGSQYLPYFVSFKPGIQFHSYTDPLAEYSFLKQHLRRGDVVISDLATSWGIPFISDAKIVALFHTNPLVSDSYHRIKDLETFFKPDTSPSSRQELIKKYSATHLLLNKRIKFSHLLSATGVHVPTLTEPFLNEMIALGQIVYQDDNYVMLELKD